MNADHEHRTASNNLRDDHGGMRACVDGNRL